MAQDHSAARREFARRLQIALVENGMSQTDLAEEMKRRLPGRKGASKHAISSYIRAIAKPRPEQLVVISEILGTTPAALMPENLIPPAAREEKRVPERRMEDLHNGNVWVEIRQSLPYDKALKVLELVKD